MTECAVDEGRVKDDDFWMGLALEEAAKARRLSPPNPAVGAVIVRDGRVIGRGFTQQTGEGAGRTDAEIRSMVMSDLKKTFRPEFLNRLDEILMFRPLTRDNLSHIIDNLVAGLRSRLADRTLNLEMTDAAKALIIQNGYDPAYGARPLKRYLQSHAETLIARTILSGDLHAGDTLVVDAENGALVCRVKA